MPSTPKRPAKQCLGQQRRGADGQWWRSVRDRRGNYRWRPASPSQSVSRSARHGSREVQLSIRPDDLAARLWVERPPPRARPLAPFRPLSLVEIEAQFPDHVEEEEDEEEEEEQDDIGDETCVQRYYGPAAHLLTIDEAYDLAPYLPLTFHCLRGEHWFDEHIFERSVRYIQTITLTRWSEEAQEMEAFYSSSHYADRLRDAWDDNQLRSENESGVISPANRILGDPVYLFFARREPFVPVPGFGRGPPDVDRSPPPEESSISEAVNGIRPLPLVEIAEQMPPLPWLQTDRTIVATMANETHVRRIFGPAVQRLTAALCQRMAPYFPVRMLGVCGRDWYVNEEDRHHGIQLRFLVHITLLGWDEPTRVLHTLNTNGRHEIEKYFGVDEHGTVTSEVGPVYVFVSGS